MFFYNFVHFLEDAGIMDVNNPLDIYCLHFIALTVIQHHPNLFCEGWANHPLQTEGNRTPQQLWMLGLHSVQSTDSNDIAVDGLLNSSEVSSIVFSCMGRRSYYCRLTGTFMDQILLALYQ